MVTKKLTVKQQKFADAFIESGNATQAAISAGYSKKTAPTIGSENLIKPNVKSYIDERMKAISDSKILSQQETLELISKFANGEMLEEVVANNGKVVEVPVSAQQQLKALEMMARRWGTFTDKVDAKVKVDPVVIVDNVPKGDGNARAD